MEALAERNANILDETPSSTGKPAKMPRLENKETEPDSAPVSGPESSNLIEMASVDETKENSPAEAVREAPAEAMGAEKLSADEPAALQELKPDVADTAEPSSSVSKAQDKLLIKKLSDKATLPKRGSAGAAGYDLASAEDKVVPKHGKALIKTDLAIRVPHGSYGRVAPRSGLASKNFIDTGAGVIDEDYRGNVGVLLFNHSDEDFQVKVGDRVAQLVLEKIAVPEVVEVDELDATERGGQGYGSTGVTAK